jgi:hypothetical protein
MSRLYVYIASVLFGLLIFKSTKAYCGEELETFHYILGCRAAFDSATKRSEIKTTEPHTTTCVNQLIADKSAMPDLLKKKGADFYEIGCITGVSIILNKKSMVTAKIKTELSDRLTFYKKNYCGYKESKGALLAPY